MKRPTRSGRGTVHVTAVDHDERIFTAVGWLAAASRVILKQMHIYVF